MERERAPSFEECMRMMRHKHDPERKEVGFGWLQETAVEHTPRLIEELQTECDPGVTCWILELLASTNSDAVVPVIAPYLGDDRDSVRRAAREWLRRMDTRAARTAIWRHGNPGR